VPAVVLHALKTVEALREGRTSAPEGDGGKPVPIQHAEAVIPLVDRRIGAMIRLQLLTGARPAEVVQMPMRRLEMTGINGPALDHVILIRADRIRGVGALIRAMAPRDPSGNEDGWRPRE
jgi:hypothetical protein